MVEIPVVLLQLIINGETFTYKVFSSLDPDPAVGAFLGKLAKENKEIQDVDSVATELVEILFNIFKDGPVIDLVSLEESLSSSIPDQILPSSIYIPQFYKRIFKHYFEIYKDRPIIDLVSLDKALSSSIPDHILPTNIYITEFYQRIFQHYFEIYKNMDLTEISLHMNTGSTEVSSLLQEFIKELEEKVEKHISIEYMFTACFNELKDQLSQELTKEDRTKVIINFFEKRFLENIAKYELNSRVNSRVKYRLLTVLSEYIFKPIINDMEMETDEDTRIDIYKRNATGIKEIDKLGIFLIQMKLDLDSAIEYGLLEGNEEIKNLYQEMIQKKEGDLLDDAGEIARKLTVLNFKSYIADPKQFVPFDQKEIEILSEIAEGDLEEYPDTDFYNVKQYLVYLHDIYGQNSLILREKMRFFESLVFDNSKDKSFILPKNVRLLGSVCKMYSSIGDTDRDPSEFKSDISSIMTILSMRMSQNT